MRVRYIVLMVMSLLHANYNLVSVRHILSLVSRVVSRDASRTVAAVQDVFVALCEDDAMYGMFRSMKGAWYCPR